MAEDLLKEVEKGIVDLFSDSSNQNKYSKSSGSGNGKSSHSHDAQFLLSSHQYERYINIEKSSVLQSARAFHDSTLVRNDPLSIITTIVQLIHLQNDSKKFGHKLTKVEATEVFFGITKLFVSTDSKLRRMVYVILKDLYGICDPSDVIIVTSCLTKDMTSNVDIYKANALRVVTRIIDTSMLAAIERYIKQSIIDKSHFVASAALVSALHLIQPFANKTSINQTLGQGQAHSSRASESENVAIVKRWINEVQEAIKSKHEMVQYHATLLFYSIKQHDRLAVSKFVQKYTANVDVHKKNKMSQNKQNTATSASGNQNYSNTGSPTITSPLAITCFIRYTAKLLHEEILSGRTNIQIHPSSSVSSSSSIANVHTSTTYTTSIAEASQLCTMGFTFLTSCLKHESEMVAFEAASAICKLPHAQPQDIQPALSILQLLLSSLKPAARLSTIKLLCTLSNTYPNLVSRFNDCLEALIGDSNKLIGTLSIITLLKTTSTTATSTTTSSSSSSSLSSHELSIDRLLKQISSFLHHLAEEYKIMVIKSLSRTCVHYPTKYYRIIVGGFLSKFLREEGGFIFKQTIVNTIINLMEILPETKESGLLYLCEFIEDCEFVSLSTHIITVIGTVGPTTSCPARYVRFLYNRCILENSMIRSSAVYALGKFGVYVKALRTSILYLLKSCVNDESDETRDRVILMITILEDLCDDDDNDNDGDGDGGDKMNELQEKVDNGDETTNTASLLLFTKLPFSFDNLEKRLKLYKVTPGAMESNNALTFDDLPIVEENGNDIHNDMCGSRQNDGVGNCELGLLLESNSTSFDIGGSASTSTAGGVQHGSNVIYQIPELAALGRIFKSSTPIPLTETETEYVVQCLKHIFDQHVVLQFMVTNTIDDQRLDNVSVSVESDDENVFEITGEMPAQSIKYGSTQSCFSVLERNENTSLSSCVFNCELKFTVVQIDPSTGEEEEGVDPYEEEYPLEHMEIYVSDFVAKTSSALDFRKSWEGIGNKYEVLQKFALQERSLEGAVKAIVDCMGMSTCDGTHQVKAAAKQHMLHLSGIFLGGVAIAVRSQVALGPSGSIILKIAIRSGRADVSKLMSECIG